MSRMFLWFRRMMAVGLPVCMVVMIVGSSPSAVADGVPEFAPWVERTLPASGEEERTLPTLAMPPDVTPNARAALLIAQSGEIVYAKNAHEPLPPASITKIMTMLLVMEALESGKLTSSTLVRTSERAASMGGSQIFLQPGESMTVQQLLKGVAMASANDAAVALAEHIAGSEQQFVERMNERAKRLGLRHTRFQNVNGLPVADHYMSAHDIAQLSRELLKHPDILTYTSAYEDYLRRDTPHPFWLVNTNKLVRVYEGADGLKTGYTQEAQFCLAATASRNGMRWIAVVMGAPSTKVRNREVAALFDYGFGQFERQTIVAHKQMLGRIDVEQGVVRSFAITAEQPYTVVLPKGARKESVQIELKWRKPLIAPIAQRQQIGQMLLRSPYFSDITYPLYAPIAIDRASFWTHWRSMPRKLFGL